MKNFALLGSVAAAALVWAAPVVAQDESEREETITFADYRLPAEILVSASRDGSLVRDSFTGSALVLSLIHI